MPPDAQRTPEQLALPLAGAILVVVAILALAGVLDDAAVLAAPVAVAAALVAWAWWRGRDRREALEEDVAEAEAQKREAGERERGERVRLNHELRQRDAALGRERELVARLQHMHRAEREWNRELRAQLARMHTQHGLLVEGDDARALVLRAAIELVEAEKGLLISRSDADADGDLDTVLSHGFEHDPEGSLVAQRFARQVLDVDETIREDEPVVGEGERPTPADEEIDNLVAIPLYLHDRFSGVVLCANRPGGFEDLDDDLLLALGDHAGTALHHSHLRGEVQAAHRGAVRMLAEALAARDPVAHHEAGGLALRASALADQLGLDEHARDVLICATLLRDVGYLALSARLLTKPGLLSDEERGVLELHPRIGFNVLRQLPALREVAYAVLYSHERWDGRGYPAGLGGDAIPLPARALAVLSAYGALVNERPYRPARSSEAALAELVAEAGHQFDPEITQLFVELERRAPARFADTITDAVVEALPLGSPNATALLDEPLVDHLTLLGNHRAFLEEAQATADAASEQRAVAVVIVQLEELARVNEASFGDGDRLIQEAARNTQRAAARFGGSAFRDSGRRLAVIAHLEDGHGAAELLEEVQVEFTLGPAVRLGLAVWQPGDRGTDLVARARGMLLQDVPLR